jgi:superfamily II DNA or RNA helicase
MPNPVNGFYFDDICNVLRRHRAGEPTGIIPNYLSAPKEANRVDCTKNESIKRSDTTDRLPDGRWPSTHTLALMQQVAINEAFSALDSGGGIFSVNGPPGTGKTTLLMDVVAGILVERAKVLCTFDDPSSAFRKRWEAQYQGVSRPTAIFALNERLHGFSIVVASSNNGAVENITRELPNVTKLDRQYLDLPPCLRQTVKTQNPWNGELSHGIVSTTVH